ncbi:MULTISPECIES: multicopper oxidase family protein [Actinoalloteichus]|uniref:Multicopper oxidase CueO n=1 Tax=Actinoalloteichus fjordicus TaxID=1612552 RepID=A0AAC9LDK0_9PSEU|nr:MULTISPECIES: multicopper oxidase domain-containing protein [Actinoalloteichus]APU14354.1 putative multicopper oxidase [Actinoalloteichus fjordicus]APU20323.1 putative multicopper oxidase [Actinoalloteichus sp. GBA129-24]
MDHSSGGTALSRRQLIGIGAGTAAALLTAAAPGASAAQRAVDPAGPTVDAAAAAAPSEPVSAHPVHSVVGVDRSVVLPRTVGDETPTTELTKFLDPMPVPPVLRPAEGELTTIVKQVAQTRLHSELPPTTVWTYDGHFPGPTIEVRRGRRVLLAWRNGIEGAFPVTAVDVPLPEEGEPSPSDLPGRGGGTPIPEVARLPAWSVTHLHGGVVAAGSDGWANNAVLSGESQLCEYPNQQPAAMLWYHDHAMMITRWNVYAGLVGTYLIRDDEEDALRLPSGDREIPLVIADRNLDVADDGSLTGALLHKTVAQRAFTGPFTLVNGVIWPHLAVGACWYRFRVLNSSNARTYRLALQDESGSPITGAAWQIGTDSGLLPEPVEIPADGLIMAPAERADLLIDFGPWRGRTVRLMNTGGTPVHPEVMEFRVETRRAVDRFRLPAETSRSYERLPGPHTAARHRLLILANGPTGHGQLWEMRRLDPAHDHIPDFDGVTVHDGFVQVQGPDGEVVTYRRLCRVFEDTVNWFVRHDDWEDWHMLSLAAPTHPMHLHLVRFQALARDHYVVTETVPGEDGRPVVIGGFDESRGGTLTPIRYEQSGTLLPDELGWKDTVRVARGEEVTIMARFEGSTGQYMYHCHLLEHEDMGMMRPFVVAPEPVVTLMEQLHGDGGHGHGGH